MDVSFLIAGIEQHPYAITPGIAVTVSLLVATITAAAVVVMRERAKRLGDKGIAESQQKAIAEQSRREQMHFEQGQLINQTGLKKMQLETQLLQTQVKIAEHELASRLRNDQINTVAVEKLRLEVESMKLHIREQHKRLDEFGGGYE